LKKKDVGKVIKVAGTIVTVEFDDEAVYKKVLNKLKGPDHYSMGYTIEGK